MNRSKQLGLGAGILALGLLLGGCGFHAGFHIGNSAAPATAHVTNATGAQPDMNAMHQSS